MDIEVSLGTLDINFQFLLLIVILALLIAIVGVVSKIYRKIHKIKSSIKENKKSIENLVIEEPVIYEPKVKRLTELETIEKDFKEK